MSEARVVRFDVEDGVGVITVDNPPVNALGPGVREGIIEAVERGNADAGVSAMVLIGAGRSFIAGADIRQFGKARAVTTGQSTKAFDESAKPVVAAIHGYALGGGLEHALACHYRVAVPSAKVGLPEVLIGILPGGGGTQRLPRLIGPKAAMELIVSGRHVPAAEAKKLGIIDEIVDEKDLRGAAIRFAKGVASKRPLPRVRDKNDRLAEAKSDPGMFEAMRKSIARKARNQKAPYNCIAAVEASTTAPSFEEGLEAERRLFSELENADEAKALRYAFFAEREVAKIPGAPKDFKPPRVKSAAVVGAGTMGGGIAMCFADYGIPVKVLEATREALDKGLQRVRDNYATSVKRGSITQQQMDERLPRIQTVERYEDIADCDVVIEAVFERIDVKKEVFAKLDAVMKPGALLLTNSSAIDTDIMANVTKRPRDVAGAHFFAPANVMKLCEVVTGHEHVHRDAARRDADGPRHGEDQRGRRHLRRLRGQPQPRAVHHRNDADARRRRAAGENRQGDGRFRLSAGTVRGERHLGPRHKLRHAQAPRGRRSELPQAACARPPGRDGTQGSEDRRGLVSLRERRPHAASRRSGEECDLRGRDASSASSSARSPMTRFSSGSCSRQ